MYGKTCTRHDSYIVSGTCAVFSNKPAVCTSEQQNNYDLKMATGDFSETLIRICQKARRHIQKHNRLDSRYRVHQILHKFEYYLHECNTSKNNFTALRP